MVFSSWVYLGRSSGERTAVFIERKNVLRAFD